MSLAPLLAASPAVQVHAAAASLALVLGSVQLVRKQRDRLHRAIGWGWMAAMASAALSSFLVHEIRTVLGLFSPIHLLSILTLAGLPRAVWYARQHLVRKHRRMVLILYWFGLVLPGALTLLPGRIMSKAVFGPLVSCAPGLAFRSRSHGQVIVPTWLSWLRVSPWSSAPALGGLG
jgi:uncharacterized membrane protein